MGDAGRAGIDAVIAVPAAIEYGHVEVPSPGVGGFKGCGEGGAIGATPAVINAINDALAPLGVTVTRLPATPASIVAAIDEAAARP